MVHRVVATGMEMVHQTAKGPQVQNQMNEIHVTVQTVHPMQIHQLVSERMKIMQIHTKAKFYHLRFCSFSDDEKKNPKESSSSSLVSVVIFYMEIVRRIPNVSDDFDRVLGGNRRFRSR